MKLRMVLLFFVIALGLTISACGGGAGGAPSGGDRKGDAAKGKSKFDGTCISCHGPDAKGLPGLGKDMTTSVFIKSLTDQQLVDFVKKGRPASDPANTTKVDMPAKGGNPAFTDSDLFDIVAYIRTLSK